MTPEQYRYISPSLFLVRMHAPSLPQYAHKGAYARTSKQPHRMLLLSPYACMHMPTPHCALCHSASTAEAHAWSRPAGRKRWSDTLIATRAGHYMVAIVSRHCSSYAAPVHHACCALDPSSSPLLCPLSFRL